METRDIERLITELQRDSEHDHNIIVLLEQAVEQIKRSENMLISIKTEVAVRLEELAKMKEALTQLLPHERE